MKHGILVICCPVQAEVWPNFHKNIPSRRMSAHFFVKMSCLSGRLPIFFVKMSCISGRLPIFFVKMSCLSRRLPNFHKYVWFRQTSAHFFIKMSCLSGRLPIFFVKMSCLSRRLLNFL